MPPLVILLGVYLLSGAHGVLVLNQGGIEEDEVSDTAAEKRKKERDAAEEAARRAYEEAQAALGEESENEWPEPPEAGEQNSEQNPLRANIRMLRQESMTLEAQNILSDAEQNADAQGTDADAQGTDADAQGTNADACTRSEVVVEACEVKEMITPINEEEKKQMSEAVARNRSEHGEIVFLPNFHLFSQRSNYWWCGMSDKPFWGGAACWAITKASNFMFSPALAASKEFKKDCTFAATGIRGGTIGGDLNKYVKEQKCVDARQLAKQMSEARNHRPGYFCHKGDVDCTKSKIKDAADQGSVYVVPGKMKFGMDNHWKKRYAFTDDVFLWIQQQIVGTLDSLGLTGKKELSCSFPVGVVYKSAESIDRCAQTKWPYEPAHWMTIIGATKDGQRLYLAEPYTNALWQDNRGNFRGMNGCKTTPMTYVGDKNQKSFLKLINYDNFIREFIPENKFHANKATKDPDGKDRLNIELTETRDEVNNYKAKELCTINMHRVRKSFIDF